MKSWHYIGRHTPYSNLNQNWQKMKKCLVQITYLNKNLNLRFWKNFHHVTLLDFLIFKPLRWIYKFNFFKILILCKMFSRFFFCGFKNTKEVGCPPHSRAHWTNSVQRPQRAYLLLLEFSSSTLYTTYSSHFLYHGSWLIEPESEAF